MGACLVDCRLQAQHWVVRTGVGGFKAWKTSIPLVIFAFLSMIFAIHTRLVSLQKLSTEKEAVKRQQNGLSVSTAVILQHDAPLHSMTS